jgi:hypothetical protein
MMAHTEATMPDDLYCRDVLLWSERQAELLRRLSRGEQPNEEPDWPNLIEEVESVGQSQLSACESLLRKALEHLLKVLAFPHGPVEHWENEVSGFLADASSRFTPSMAQRIDVDRQYGKAYRRVGRLKIDGRAAGPLPAACPFVLADLLPSEEDELPDPAALLAALQIPASR